MAFESFTSHIPGHIPSAANMDRFNTNRKRPDPYYDFNASKRLQQSKASNNHDSLFLSDDEGDAQIDEDLFGRNNDDDFATLVDTPRPQPARPVQSQPTQSRPAQQRASTQHRPATQSTSTPTTNGATTTNDTSNSGNTSKPTNGRSEAAAVDLVEVKDEKDEDEDEEPDWVKDVADKDKVKLFVGRRNKQVLVKRVDLAKSPILTSWIIDDPDQGSYIMRPQLARTEFANFDAVLQFLHSSEYAPLLVDNRLDGLKSNEAYAKELVRSGRIYIIAQRFQIEGLAELVFGKIDKVDVSKFSIKAIVELAGVIFGDKNSVVLPHPAAAAATAAVNRANASAGSQEGVAGLKDKLEEWIITQVAKNLQEIMNNQQETFWKVERKTSKKLFFAQVMEEAAVQYRVTGGKLPGPVVELD